METTTIHVAASIPTPSTCLAEATDVDVTVTLPDGREIDGGVTLVADRYDGRPVPAGDAPDCWVEGGLLLQLYSALGGRQVADSRVMREWLSTLAAEAAAVVPGHWVSGRWVIDHEVMSAVESREVSE